MRVAIVSIYHESNTFVSRPTTLVDFRQQLLLVGPDSRKAFRWKNHEVMGFFAGLEGAGIEPVPLLIAAAAPGGTITADAFGELMKVLSEQLQAASHFDGVLVAPHGAAVSRDLLDADGYWLSLIRRHVGPSMPIIGTFDPHANLSPEMVQATNALVAYRTNPHLDQHLRGQEAAQLMVRTLRKEIRPTQAAAFPPVAINIERQFSADPPCKDLYSMADAMLARPGVLSNSVILGFRYSDVPKMGSSFLVVTDSNQELAQKLADEMGEVLWQRRKEFVGELISVDDAIDKAMRSPAPVCLLDMGDNVGGGSAADGTVLARALHHRRIGMSFVCIADPESARQAKEAGLGRKVDLHIGGKTDRYHGRPLKVEATVQSLHEGKFTEPMIRHGAMLNFDMGPTTIVTTESGLTMMLTSERVFPVSLAQLTSCGLNPASFRILVAKGVHAPVAAYQEVCKTFIRVNTPGSTTADTTTLDYHRRRRPLFPFDF